VLKLLLASVLLFQAYTPKVILRPFRIESRRDTSDNIVVLHYDNSKSANLTIKYLKRRGNAYHYIIDRSGLIFKLIDPKYEARHAGLSFYKGYFRLNHYSIGICFVNDGKQLYTERQYQSAAWLITILQQRYPDIDSTKIVGHSDIALPFGRKPDPGEHFEWAKLFQLINDRTSKT
jgi:N-acetyl-anhydromuramyl-L-alanine amidase AmpD